MEKLGKALSKAHVSGVPGKKFPLQIERLNIFCLYSLYSRWNFCALSLNEGK